MSASYPRIEVFLHSMQPNIIFFLPTFLRRSHRIDVAHYRLSTISLLLLLRLSVRQQAVTHSSCLSQDFSDARAVTTAAASRCKGEETPGDRWEEKEEATIITPDVAMWRAPLDVLRRG